ncbi:MAG: hypothetical protein RMJ52_18800, partial [Gemmataceae bacterium]|nr:hypothetical protein [Gemmataceae bacterium]
MNPPVAPDTAATSSPRRWAWGLVFLALCTWHAWLTLTLFGETRPWEGLISDEPIISGRHPLHLYHGYLGARSLIETGTSCCYDPAFQAGYPKTPIFDSGSRPAELFLLLGGGAFRPAAYKLGLAACSLLVPWALLATARGMGLTLGPACLAGALGLGVWWGEPCRELLEVGDLDLLLAALAGLVHVGLLLRYDRQPSFSAWITLLAVNAVGWFAHPFFFSLLIPLNLVYYLTVGTRHRHPLAWHFGLGSALLGGILANGFWLIDWVQYWWIRSPLPVGIPILTHRTLYAFWTADLWGEEVDRALAVFLLSAGLLGIVVLNIRKERAAGPGVGPAPRGGPAQGVGGRARETRGRRRTPPPPRAPPRG